MDYGAQLHAAFRDLVYIGAACGWFWVVRQIAHREKRSPSSKAASILFGMALLVGLASQAEPDSILRFLVVFSVVAAFGLRASVTARK